ncbi:MAG: RibD family protein [Actinomycetota bacterium]|nr:RibD family protein [Actinomycetota bacterium]
MGHVTPVGTALAEVVSAPADVTRLLGDVRAHADRPFVAVKYAQSIDGRIATRTGDSKWISSEEERAVSHALRARCDAIMVGVETVITDDPALTVRMVPGASPARVVLDSTLRIGLGARVLNDDAPTMIVTTDQSDPAKRVALRSMNVGVHVVPRGPLGVDIEDALTRLYDLGVRSLIVEGGGRVITSLLTARLVDRVIVAFAPRILGAGVEAVGDLGTSAVLEGVALTDRCVQLVGNDVVMAFTPTP